MAIESSARACRASTSTEQGSSRKRNSSQQHETIDLTQDEPVIKRRKSNERSTPIVKPDAGSRDDATAGSLLRSSNPSSQSTEKRLKRFRPHAPNAFRDILGRALTQRMFVISRDRSRMTDPVKARSDDEPIIHYPIETVTLAGTTGNVYTVQISRVPNCDCPHARKGNQCKHIAFVMARVLRAPEHLQYQLALLSSELEEIFDRAPALPQHVGLSTDGHEGGSDENPGNVTRKNIKDECCPICCEDFVEGGKEDIVWCKSGCGNNLHKECFQQWARSRKGAEVTCPFCRTGWQDVDGRSTADLISAGTTTQEGYINISRQLGISNRRDYSTYNEFWLRGRLRNGYLE